MARANGRFDVRSALTLHEEREVDMLASLYLNANGHGLRVAELPKALQVRAVQSWARADERAGARNAVWLTPPLPVLTPAQPLELCDGIPDESIEQVVHQTMSRLGHSKVRVRAALAIARAESAGGRAGGLRGNVSACHTAARLHTRPAPPSSRRVGAAATRSRA